MKLTPPVELVSPPDPAAWDALVEGSDTATIFHTSAWARLWIAEWPGARWEAVVLLHDTAKSVSSWSQTAGGSGTAASRAFTVELLSY